jgi:hypothetical protein
MEQEKVSKDSGERVNNGNNCELVKKSTTVLTTTHSQKSLHTSQMQKFTEEASQSQSNHNRHEISKSENSKGDRDKHGENGKWPVSRRRCNTYVISNPIFRLVVLEKSQEEEEQG